jgi:GH25 family lysozyme M1 (1,4-beta-N-acetylmuramidase)
LIGQPSDDLEQREEIDQQKNENMADILNVIIDLSHHSGNIDLAQAQAAGIVGVIHKATQGTGHQDPRDQARRDQTKP